MAKPLFTFLFLLGTVSYFAQGFPKKLIWSQSSERPVMHFPAELGYLLEERNASRSTVKAADDCKCGRKNIERIVGEDADQGEWFWQAKLMIFPHHSDDFLLCGDSVINDEYILSAAHCFYGLENFTIQLALGAYRLYDDNEVKYEVEYVLQHQNYETRFHTHDIALLKLTTNIEYTSNICSVCLPTSSIANGEECYVTGWGTTIPGTNKVPEVLQEAEVNIVSRSECQQQYGHLDDSQICAAAPGKDSCQGDSGGPLVHENSDGVWDLVGIVSYGKGCANPNYAGLYSNVFELLPWIEENTEGSQYCSRE